MYRWLGMFRAKAPPKSTDAYRTAAEVVLDEVTMQIPADDDDVEAPPVAVRAVGSRIGPDEISTSRFILARVVLGFAIAFMIVIWITGHRP